MGLFSAFYDLLTDQYTDRQGYRRNKRDHSLVHRIEAERKLGRKLQPLEVVGHRDGNTMNNARENLLVFKNRAALTEAHEHDAARNGEWWSYKG